MIRGYIGKKISIGSVVVLAMAFAACGREHVLSSEQAIERARFYIREHEDTLVAYLDSAGASQDGGDWLVQFVRRSHGEFPAYRSIRVNQKTGVVTPELDR